VRGIMVGLSCQAVGGDPQDVLPAAVAVELLHGFTLIHDDIMDSSPIRRGRPTVHMKWSENVAILSGDVMMGIAITELHSCCHISTDPLAVIKELGKGLIEVCEGQALDMELAIQPDVSVTQYFNMIEKKTARLLETACAIGGMLGNGSAAELNALTLFGRSVGIAFQVQDDVLDLIGAPDFGKKLGGDIEEGKRTWMMLEAKRRLADNQLVKSFFDDNGLGSDDVPEMIQLLHTNGILDEAQQIVRNHTQTAYLQLDVLPSNQGSRLLRELAETLITRTI